MQIDESDIAMLEDVADIVDTLTMYERIAMKSAIYPGRQSSLGMVYCALKLNGEAGELAEHIGKAIRDDRFFPNGINDDGERLADLGANLTNSRRNLIVREIGDCLWYLAALCHELRVPLRRVAVANLQKLLDRQQRDKLQGDGDNR